MAQAKSTIFEGCLTALVTPMKDGKVDFAALTALVDWQIDAGIDGLVAVGTTGESATLEIDEHIEVVRRTVAAAAGRVPVIAGAGGNATAEALDLTRAAEEAGADAVLQVTPYYNKPTQEGLFRHFEAIAKSTRLPVILYNVPGRTACDMLPDTVERLAQFSNVVAIKEASGSLPRGTELMARVGDRLTLLSGDDATTFPFFAIGARGVISVVSNVAPHDFARMWDAVNEGDWAAARAIHFRLRNLINLLFVESNPIPSKASLALMGRCTDEVRLPLVPCTPGLTAQLHDELTRLELLGAAR